MSDRIPMDLVDDEEPPTRADDMLDRAGTTAAGDRPTAAADAPDGLAAKMRATARKLEAETQDFEVPGWDGDLVVRARKLNERETDKADTPLKTIALATAAVRVRENEDAPFLEKTWNEIGALMGVPDGTTQSVIIHAVFGKSAVAIKMFSSELVAWMAGKHKQLQNALGE